MLSQEELPFMADVHRSYISQLERGVEVADPEHDSQAVSCSEGSSEQFGSSCGAGRIKECSNLGLD